jgi:hypothetical protein
MIYISTKIERINAEIQRLREKSQDIQSRIRTLEGHKTDEENALIIQMVRKIRMTPTELEHFLASHKNSLTNPTKTPPVNAATFKKFESEDKPL